MIHYNVLLFGSSSTVSWRLNEKSSEIIETNLYIITYRFYTDFSFTFCTDFSLLIFISLDFLFKRQDTVGQAMQLIILE